MKLKDSTFAIIAEKKDSISHKWFNENLDAGQCKPIGDEWEDIMEYQNGLWLNSFKVAPGNYAHHIYTESEFEALLKSEQENGRFEQVLQKGIDNSRLNKEDWHINENAPREPQITITYKEAVKIIAERLNVDKGIIKIEMP